MIYFSKSRALKVLESPLTADLKTLLSATFAISKSRVVKQHIKNTLVQLNSPEYKLSAYTNLTFCFLEDQNVTIDWRCV